VIRISTGLLVAGAASLAFFLAPARAKQPATADVFQLLLGFSAKESCSCAFVDGQTDAYCQAFGQQPGYAVTVVIDHTANTVSSSYAGLTRTAHATTGAGCVLDLP
jgi:hypothetical protein